MEIGTEECEALAAAGWEREIGYTPEGLSPRYEDSWYRKIAPSVTVHIDVDPCRWPTWFVHTRDTSPFASFAGPTKTSILVEGLHSPMAAHMYLLLEGDGDARDGALRLWIESQRKKHPPTIS